MPVNNKIIIITAPSGAGKTSITHFLLRTFPQLAFSVSAATRQARGTEKTGVDYYFITGKEFKHKNKSAYVNISIPNAGEGCHGEIR